MQKLRKKYSKFRMENADEMTENLRQYINIICNFLDVIGHTE